MANVKVAVRVRPPSSREITDGGKVIVEIDEKVVRIKNMKLEGRPDGPADSREKVLEYGFDYCYWSVDPAASNYTSQEEVFQDLGTIVLSGASKGYNVCLFAYGQTGSGKTYTMMGTPASVGLTPRICEALFSRSSDFSESQNSCRIEVSFLEIYNEKVRDLLRSPDRKKPFTLRVREHPEKGPYVQGLSQHLVSDYKQTVNLLEEGIANRMTAATHIHDASSRSHAIFTIQYTQAILENNLPSEIVSKINLVDLAGSERADPNYCRDRLTEGSNINKSLVTLGIVISTLAQNSQMFSSCQSINSMASEGESSNTGSQSSSQSGGSRRHCYVPYRDSILTWLLKDSLGGNSKTVMVATISPSSSSYSETISTLRYAAHARNIINKPRVNEDANVKLIRELREEIDRLKTMLMSFELRNSSPSLSEDRDGHFSDIVMQNELKIEQLTKDWTDKWKDKQELMEEYRVDINREREGVLIDSRLPHLIAVDGDVLSTGIVFYHLREGTTRIGSSSDHGETNIVLQGSPSDEDYCEIVNECGVVSLKPCQKGHCAVNGHEVTEPCRLAQGAVIVLGKKHTFRFNHPAEAAILRQRRRQVSEGFLLRSGSCEWLDVEELSSSPSYDACLSPQASSELSVECWDHEKEQSHVALSLSSASQRLVDQQHYVEGLREELLASQHREEQELEREQARILQQHREIEQWLLQEQQRLKFLERQKRDLAVQTDQGLSSGAEVQNSAEKSSLMEDRKRLVQQELLRQHALKRAEKRIRRKRLCFQLERIAKKQHLLEAKKELQQLEAACMLTKDTSGSTETVTPKGSAPTLQRRHSFSSDLLRRLYSHHAPVYSHLLKQKKSFKPSTSQGHWKSQFRQKSLSEECLPDRTSSKTGHSCSCIHCVSGCKLTCTTGINHSLSVPNFATCVLKDFQRRSPGFTARPNIRPKIHSSSALYSQLGTNKEKTKSKKSPSLEKEKDTKKHSKGFDRVKKLLARSVQIKKTLSGIFKKTVIPRGPIKSSGTETSKVFHSLKRKPDKAELSKIASSFETLDQIEKPTDVRKWHSAEVLGNNVKLVEVKQHLKDYKEDLMDDNQTCSDTDSQYSLDSLSSTYTKALAKKLEDDERSEQEHSASQSDDSQISQDSLAEDHCNELKAKNRKHTRRSKANVQRLTLYGNSDSPEGCLIKAGRSNLMGRLDTWRTKKRMDLGPFNIKTATDEMPTEVFWQHHSPVPESIDTLVRFHSDSCETLRLTKTFPFLDEKHQEHISWTNESILCNNVRVEQKGSSLPIESKCFINKLDVCTNQELSVESLMQIPRSHNMDDPATQSLTGHRTTLFSDQISVNGQSASEPQKGSFSVLVLDSFITESVLQSTATPVQPAFISGTTFISEDSTSLVQMCLPENKSKCNEALVRFSSELAEVVLANVFASGDRKPAEIFNKSSKPESEPGFDAYHSNKGENISCCPKENAFLAADVLHQHTSAVGVMENGIFESQNETAIEDMHLPHVTLKIQEDCAHQEASKNDISVSSVQEYMASSDQLLTILEPISPAGESKDPTMKETASMNLSQPSSPDNSSIDQCYISDSSHPISNRLHTDPNLQIQTASQLLGNGYATEPQPPSVEAPNVVKAIAICHSNFNALGNEADEDLSQHCDTNLNLDSRGTEDLIGTVINLSNSTLPSFIYAEKTTLIGEGELAGHEGEPETLNVMETLVERASADHMAPDFENQKTITVQVTSLGENDDGYGVVASADLSGMMDKNKEKYASFMKPQIKTSSSECNVKLQEESWCSHDIHETLKQGVGAVNHKCIITFADSAIFKSGSGTKTEEESNDNLNDACSKQMNKAEWNDVCIIQKADPSRSNTFNEQTRDVGCSLTHSSANDEEPGESISRLETGELELNGNSGAERFWKGKSEAEVVKQRDNNCVLQKEILITEQPSANCQELFIPKLNLITSNTEGITEQELELQNVTFNDSELSLHHITNTDVNTAVEHEPELDRTQLFDEIGRKPSSETVYCVVLDSIDSMQNENQKTLNSLSNKDGSSDVNELLDQSQVAVLRQNLEELTKVSGDRENLHRECELEGFQRNSLYCKETSGSHLPESPDTAASGRCPMHNICDDEMSNEQTGFNTFLETGDSENGESDHQMKSCDIDRVQDRTILPALNIQSQEWELKTVSPGRARHTNLPMVEDKNEQVVTSYTLLTNPGITSDVQPDSEEHMSIKLGDSNESNYVRRDLIIGAFHHHDSSYLQSDTWDPQNVQKNEKSYEEYSAPQNDCVLQLHQKEKEENHNHHLSNTLKYVQIRNTSSFECQFPNTSDEVNREDCPTANGKLEKRVTCELALEDTHSYCTASAFVKHGADLIKFPVPEHKRNLDHINKKNAPETVKPDCLFGLIVTAESSSQAQSESSLSGHGPEMAHTTDSICQSNIISKKSQEKNMSSSSLYSNIISRGSSPSVVTEGDYLENICNFSEKRDDYPVSSLEGVNYKNMFKQSLQEKITETCLSETDRIVPSTQNYFDIRMSNSLDRVFQEIECILPNNLHEPLPCIPNQSAEFQDTLAEMGQGNRRLPKDETGYSIDKVVAVLDVSSKRNTISPQSESDSVGDLQYNENNLPMEDLPKPFAQTESGYPSHGETLGTNKSLIGTVYMEEFVDYEATLNKFFSIEESANQAVLEEKYNAHIPLIKHSDDFQSQINPPSETASTSPNGDSFSSPKFLKDLLRHEKPQITLSQDQPQSEINHLVTLEHKAESDYMETSVVCHTASTEMENVTEEPVETKENKDTTAAPAISHKSSSLEDLCSLSGIELHFIESERRKYSKIGNLRSIQNDGKRNSTADVQKKKQRFRRIKAHSPESGDLSSSSSQDSKDSSSQEGGESYTLRGSAIRPSRSRGLGWVENARIQPCRTRKHSNSKSLPSCHFGGTSIELDSTDEGMTSPLTPSEGFVRQSFRQERGWRHLHDQKESLHFGSSDINPYTHAWQQEKTSKTSWKQHIFGSASDIMFQPLSQGKCKQKCSSVDNDLNAQNSPLYSHLSSYARTLSSTLSSVEDLQGQDSFNLGYKYDKLLNPKCQDSAYLENRISPYKIDSDPLDGHSVQVDEIMLLYPSEPESSVKSSSEGTEKITCDQYTQTWTDNRVRKASRHRRSSTQVPASRKEEATECPQPAAWTSLQNISIHLSQLLHNTSDILGNLHNLRTVDPPLNHFSPSLSTVGTCNSTYNGSSKRDSYTQTVGHVAVQTDDIPLNSKVSEFLSADHSKMPQEVNVIVKVVSPDLIDVTHENKDVVLKVAERDWEPGVKMKSLTDLSYSNSSSLQKSVDMACNSLSQANLVGLGSTSPMLLSSILGQSSSPSPQLQISSVSCPQLSIKKSPKLQGDPEHYHSSPNRNNVNSEQTRTVDRASSPILTVEAGISSHNKKSKSSVCLLLPNMSDDSFHEQKNFFSSSWHGDRDRNATLTESYSSLHKNKDMRKSSKGAKVDGVGRTLETNVRGSQRWQSTKIESDSQFVQTGTIPDGAEKHLPTGVGLPHSFRQTTSSSCMTQRRGYSNAYTSPNGCDSFTPLTISENSEMTIQLLDDDAVSLAPSECNTEVLLNIKPLQDEGLTQPQQIHQKCRVPEDLPVHNKFSHWSGVNYRPPSSLSSSSAFPVSESLTHKLKKSGQEELMGSSSELRTLDEDRVRVIEVLRRERAQVMAAVQLEMNPHQLTVELTEAKLNYSLGETDALLKVLHSGDEVPVGQIKQHLYDRHMKNIEGLRKEREMRLQHCRRTRSLSPTKHSALSTQVARDADMPSRRREYLQQLRQAVVDSTRIQEPKKTPPQCPSDIEQLIRDYGKAREEAKTEIARARNRLRERTEQEKRRLEQQTLSQLLRDELKLRNQMSSSTLCTGSSLSLSSSPTSGYNSSHTLTPPDGSRHRVEQRSLDDKQPRVETRGRSPIKGIGHQRLSVQDLRMDSDVNLNEVPPRGQLPTNGNTKANSSSFIPQLSGYSAYRNIASETVASVTAEVLAASGGNVENLLNGKSAGGWKYQCQEKGVQVYYKSFSSPTKHGFLGTGLIEQPLHSLWSVVRDLSKTSLYEKALKAEQVTIVDTDIQLVHFVMNASVCYLKQLRDFCCISVESKQEQQLVLALRSVFDESLPRPTTEMVRGELLPSVWVLQPDTKDNKAVTKVFYMIQVDLGAPALPQRLLGAVAKRQAMAIVNLSNVFI
ncbi:stAR-related lipid transfer protein 9 isoform X1 [Polypterus senegalus]|uniref:stAR-related lipid transfer protein 9 isoform X1 n=1 Tax=Polypterus senegalus TaxID=55291 RepID=UPI001964CB15|nr:stAR-related lipid transfer protein 9 isoform X1 [Polypterus senegalus]